MTEVPPGDRTSSVDNVGVSDLANANTDTDKEEGKDENDVTGHNRNRRRLSEKGMAIDSITLDKLRCYFHLQSADVAKLLGIGRTMMKRVCRRLNIKKWPYRQIRSIAQTIQSYEITSLHSSEATEISEKISLMKKELQSLMADPTIDSKLLVN